MIISATSRIQTSLQMCIRDRDAPFQTGTDRTFRINGKRQGTCQRLLGIERPDRPGRTPVSYTHLTLIKKLEAGDRNIYREYIAFCNYKGKRHAMPVSYTHLDVYKRQKPISFNPFYTDDYIFDVEKKDSIKTLLPVSYTHL